MATFDTHAQAVSFRLQEVARTLSQASELAELLGLPGLARDLAVALVTAQRARALPPHRGVRQVRPAEPAQARRQQGEPMTDATTRESGVPGLVIWGKASYGYNIYWNPVGDQGSILFDRPREINHFRTVGEAKQAAQRLKDVLPWTDKAATMAAVKDRRDAVRTQIIEGLTGKTRAQLEEEEAEQRLASQRWYDGTGARDGFDGRLRAGGHQVSWKRKGQRTFWGKCSRCKGGFRSSYASMSESYHENFDPGAGDHCPAREATT